MPPRPPIPPPSLETCSFSNPELDTEGIIGSDDELDDVARAAQRSRIEKLAESYAQGAPVYILSASLRGPFDDGWVNPWRKNRRRDYTQGRSGRMKKKRATSPSPVVQETNSRKRRPYHDSEIRDTRTSAASPSSSAGLSISKSDPRADSQRRPSSKPRGNKRGLSTVSPNTPRRIPPSIVGSDVPSQHSAPSRHTDQRWLKKDHVRIGFSQVDPPTSPTTSISSRLAETRSRMAEGSSKKRKSHPSSGHRDSNKSNELKRASERGSTTPSRNVDDRLRVDTKSSSTGKHICPPPVVESLSGTSHRDRSFHVLSSSSQLPKFEYRRRRHPLPQADAHYKPPPAPVTNERSRAGSVASNDTDIADEDLELPRESLSANVIENRSPENPQGPRASFTTSNTSNTLCDTSESHLEEQTSGFHTNGNTSEKLPSAQQMQQNPTITDHTTSLRSIAMPRTNLEHDGDADTIFDPHFSTQAALRLAQKSFQNDLDTPNRIPAMSDHTGLTSHSLNPGTGGSKNITPFHRMTTTPATDDGPKSAPTTAHHLMSTQHIIDAVTPFTFSAEKKIHFLTASSHKERSSKRQSDTTHRLSSPTSPTPSENNREPPASGGETDFVHNESPEHPNIPVEMQSALAMTLSGTTPPTAQDGQGAADSFNLSQAIAEAGSWLQHSFDLNRDIMALKHSKPGSSANTARSAAVSFDTTK